MDAAERRLLLDAFDSNWIAPAGPDLVAFERDIATYLGIGNAVGLSSGTAALHLALLLLGIRPGDTVLASTFTFVASVNPILYAGAEPCFIDSELRSWNLDPQLLEDELVERSRHNELPRAVVAVDLYGQPADYEALADVCSRYDIALIEDAAESLGSAYRGRPAGTFGEMAILSFNGNKIITTGGGGALVTDRVEWAERARHLATQAREPVPHYEHIDVGFNYRMSNLAAAIGRGQMMALPQRIERRRAINERYRSALASLPGVGFAPQPPDRESNCWLTCITIEPDLAGCDRESIRRSLEAADIESRPLWKPMHLQPVHRHRRSRITGVSEHLFDRGLCLPSGSSMSDDDQDRVIAIIRSVLSR
jgi:dTDP-4-amino-4,6-dideoxygalactose transaminase